MKAPAVFDDFRFGELSPQVYGKLTDQRRNRGVKYAQNVIFTKTGSIKRAPGTTIIKTLDSSGRLEVRCVRTSVVQDVETYMVFMHRGSETSSSTLSAFAVTLDRYGFVVGDTTDHTNYRNFADDANVSLPGDAVLSSAIYFGGYAYLFFSGCEPIRMSAVDVQPEAIIDPTKDPHGLATPEGENPSCGAVFGDRLVLYEQTVSGVQSTAIYLSKVGDYSDFSDPESPTADDPLWFPLSSKHSNRIMWIEVQERLICGGNGSEFAVFSSDGGALTAANAIAREYTTFGSYTPSGAVAINDSIVFVDSSGKNLRSYLFQNDYQSYSAPLLTGHSEGLFSFADYVAYSGGNNPAIWVCADDSIFRMSYDQGQGIVGWSRYGDPEAAYSAVAASGNLVLLVTFGGNRLIEIVDHEVRAIVFRGYNGLSIPTYDSYIQEYYTPLFRSYLHHRLGSPVYGEIDGSILSSIANSGSKVRISIPLNDPELHAVSGDVHVVRSDEVEFVGEVDDIFEVTNEGITSSTQYYDSVEDRQVVAGKADPYPPVFVRPDPENFSSSMSSWPTPTTYQTLFQDDDSLAVVFDGKIMGYTSIASGDFALPEEGAEPVVMAGDSCALAMSAGKVVQAYIETVPIEAGIENGAVINKSRSVDAALFCVKTSSVSIGHSVESLKTMDFSGGLLVLGWIPRLETTEKSSVVPGDFSRPDATIVVSSVGIEPFEIVRIAASVAVSGG